VIKRLLDNIVVEVASVGLVLMAVVVAGALADEISLAVTAVGLLQLLLLGVALLIWRGQRAVARNDSALAELNRAISNVGLRAVDEARATERELGARIDALREALGSRD
jgi:uncharacterized membrane protein YqjE